MAAILINLEPNRLTKAHLAKIQSAVPEMQVQMTRDRKEIEAMLDDIEIVD